MATVTTDIMAITPTNRYYYGVIPEPLLARYFRSRFTAASRNRSPTLELNSTRALHSREQPMPPRHDEAPPPNCRTTRRTDDCLRIAQEQPVPGDRGAGGFLCKATPLLLPISGDRMAKKRARADRLEDPQRQGDPRSTGFDRYGPARGMDRARRR